MNFKIDKYSEKYGITATMKIIKGDIITIKDDWEGVDNGIYEVVSVDENEYPYMCQLKLVVKED